MHEADLIVIGAGPAGMAAAGRAADCGLSVLLLDEQPSAGGQIYRDVERASGSRGHILGRDFSEGLALTQDLARDGITHLPGAVLWQIEEGNRVVFSQNGKGGIATARRILLATGALERPMPVPGWTLPGVMTAGAAQILLKQSGVVCSDAVLVGSGPLLYLLAAQMVRAGTSPRALVETQTPRDLAGAMRHLGGALRGWRYLAKGAGLLWELRRAGVTRHTGATEIAIEGDSAAKAITFRTGARHHRLACRTVLMHHGVVPNTQAARSVGIPHLWDAAQHCFAPDIDDWGRTVHGDIFIAGDGAGIGGAKAAILAGWLAALGIAQDLGRLTEAARDTAAEPIRKQMKAERAARPFIDRAYPPYAAAIAPADGTIICRCEEVTAGDIRQMAQLGCRGPNQTKAFGRPGMGPCQGRYCGLSVTQILADTHAMTPDDVGYYRIRAPLKPVTLGEIADTASKDETDVPIGPLAG
ncbi:NAD(P)/FAD-dependent oxidoreductase [Roseovarius sp. S1116L3]|uniref:FAD/NAD(P)-dependent oxidoreductase n=1 Tax=Roseovarius roseus TaxID=3342636 RepID=UPI0037272DA4